MAYQDLEHDTEVFLGVVTGTHFSGKTTLIESFSNPNVTAELEIEEPFKASFLDSAYDDTVTPIITIPEAATRWASMLKDPALFGVNYSLDAQISAEMLHNSLVFDSVEVAYRIAQRMRLDPFYRDRYSGKIIRLSDRGYEDGHVYSAVRIAGQERLLEKDRVLKSIRPGEIKLSRLFTDIVFITDERDVDFRPEERLDPNPRLRRQIAERLRSQYAGLPLVEVRGTVDHRRQAIEAKLAELVAGKKAA